MQQSPEESLAALGRRALVGDEIPSADAPDLLCGQGRPLGYAGESWPTKDGNALVCILTIYTPELPEVPDFLRAAEYWAFFIEPRSYEQVAEDGSLVVRQYRSITSLCLLPQPAGAKGIPLQLRFREIIDYPSDFALAKAPPAVAHAAESRFECHSGIKLGGYPHLIQETAFLESLDPDYQIQLDCSNYYMYADSGIGYVYAGLSAVIWETM